MRMGVFSPESTVCNPSKEPHYIGIEVDRQGPRVGPELGDKKGGWTELCFSVVKSLCIMYVRLSGLGLGCLCYFRPLLDAPWQATSRRGSYRCLLQL